MIRLFTKLTAVVLLVAVTGGVAQAQLDLLQPPGARSVGGAAESEMRAIRRSDIGIGYTSTQLNNQTMNRMRATAPWTGVASVDANSGRRGLGSFGGSSGLSRTPGRDSRPFSGISRRPTVSPYMNLFREGFNTNQDALNYQTLVRPQIRQQRVNEQVQRQESALNQRLQSIAAQPAYNAAGSRNLIPTGSPSTFRYYSHFYPGLR
jgi:hypothetical protein